MRRASKPSPTGGLTSVEPAHPRAGSDSRKRSYSAAVTNLSPGHRVEGKSVGAGRLTVLLLVAAIILVAIARLFDWLGDGAAMVVIICASVAVAAVALFGDRS